MLNVEGLSGKESPVVLVSEAKKHQVPSKILVVFSNVFHLMEDSIDLLVDGCLGSEELVS